MYFRIHKVYCLSLIFSVVIRFNLKEHLDAHGVTAYKFAKSVKGVAPITIKKIVSGERNPSFETLELILKTLDEMGISASLIDLLEYIPEPPKKNKK
jgi:transcriptional regulator with XRE-family HTH domain